MCVWSDWPYLAVTPIKFPLKAAPVYCIFSSSCRVLEVCTFHSSSGCSTAFFPLHYSIDVSLSYFQSIVDFFGYCCFFHLTLSFSKAIGPFLTLLGPRNLPAYPTRCTIGYLTCGRRLFGAKTVLMIFTCLTLIHVFAQDLTTIFPVMFSLLISDNFSVQTFFPTVALLLIFPSFEFSLSFNFP